MPAPKILVVDDSRTVRTLVRSTLHQAGYEVMVAADGYVCLEMVQQQLPDLTVLDIQMPNLDGYGVCQAFQRMGPPYSDISILFLTTIDSNALELLASKLGAYLQKPVGPQRLLEAVQQFLPLSIAADSPSASGSDNASSVRESL